MNRRGFLAGVGGSCLTAMSGCFATDVGRTPQVLSLASVDCDPEPLSFEITLLDEKLTETDVPKLDITVTNLGKKPVGWTYGGGFGELPFPERVYSEDDNLVIGLEEHIQSQLLDTSRGCARLKHFSAANGFQKTSLEPAETITNRYAIVGIAGNYKGVCPEPGSYRMKHGFGDYGKWGFKVKLK
ncbi:hypothetical protein [Natrinema ejinorense]|uniref:hypothetical protein n=1 Tax=Natrinema ejinorense TaxID=373386 RepID=UPI00117F0F58|nr:hypothetical protein [Natrinema ejinorense]